MTGAEPEAAELEVVEYTDPLCPWAWGSEPVFRQLRAALAPGARWRRVYSILFDTDDDPAPDPAAETAWYSRYVAEVAAHTGAPRAAELDRVARSSWPASLAARAAEAQGPLVAERVLRRLRESVFVLGRPADTEQRVLECVRGVPDLDTDRLAADAASAAVAGSVRADRAEARAPLPEVLDLDGPSPHPGRAKELDEGFRYALPTLIFRSPAGHRVVPGWRPAEAYAQAVLELRPGRPAAPARRPSEQVMDLHRSLAVRDLELLTLDGGVPTGALRVDTAGGPLWLHPDEAAGHPALAGDR
ncbi:DsbA family protein [Streptacidiphilus sp. N1-12]|uniref:DsbA family protein n=2 Tax=Streptacidiphilus alkalitolerans TaxID=3342712 RepID=A0ABV6VJP4_9ACTN